MARVIGLTPEGEFGRDVECLGDPNQYASYQLEKSKYDRFGSGRGFPMPEDLAPRRFQIVRPSKKPDFELLKGDMCGMIVDDRVRDAAEAIEPGVHQFFPVEMTMQRTGETPERPHFLLNVCTMVDSVDPVHSNIKIIGKRAGYEGRSEFKFEDIPTLETHNCGLRAPRSKALVLRKDAVMGRAL
ncbi:MAG: DUF1629 domain-containing protein [Pseudomonadota bacterium]